MSSFEFQSAVDWLYSFIDYETTARTRDPSRFDLRRVVLLLEQLDNPHLKAKTIHIAGSKGKGSTAAMIQAVLMQAGFRTALYTSPHLVELTERFRINRQDISPAELTSIITRLKPQVEHVNTEDRYGKLTTFEIMTAVAFEFFTQHRAEWQVIEVGLGGRLDATNVVRSELAVITPINLEHTETLGDTLAEIAAEKAGIIKPGVAVVTAPQADEAMAAIKERCRQLKAPLHKSDPVSISDARFEKNRQLFSFKGRSGDYDIALPLLGSYQLTNAATAITALETLAARGVQISETDIETGLGSTRWPGRFQIIRDQPLTILDGAHNPAAMRALAEAVSSFLPERRQPAVLVIGASEDKDIMSMAAILSPIFDNIIAANAKHPRSMDTSLINNAFIKYGKTVLTASDVAVALKTGMELAGDSGLLCVTGSLFIVGEALKFFKQTS